MERGTMPAGRGQPVIKIPTNTAKGDDNITLRFMDVFVIEGNAEELSMYTYIIINLLKKQFEKERAEEAEKEMKLSDFFRNMSFDELLKRERDEEE